jgi:hypothetical protein
MSEGEAFRRITAARLLRRFPVVYELVESGSVHLSALSLLRDHLTDENHFELLREASGKTKRELEALLGARFPKSDAPSRIRKLPPPRAPQWDAGHVQTPPLSPLPASKPVKPVEPLCAARYKIQFTADAGLKEKLERAQNLLSHSNPSGDLAVLVERAVDLLLAILEKKKLGKTDRPRRAASQAKRAAAVTRSVRRAVFARDGMQCSFQDASGRRCQARALLELDHIQAQALGGCGEAGNVRVLCRAHNRLHAEETFGKQHIKNKIHFRQKKYQLKTAEQRSQVDNDPLPEVAQDKLLSALTNLGFRASETRGALRQIGQGKSRLSPSAPMTGLLREALQLLTPDARV